MGNRKKRCDLEGLGVVEGLIESMSSKTSITGNTNERNWGIVIMADCIYFELVKELGYLTAGILCSKEDNLVRNRVQEEKIITNFQLFSFHETADVKQSVSRSE